jgi:dipeptidyl aminopeptidase/acylaminoacyl peptidase
MVKDAPMPDDMLAETLRDRMPRLFAAGADHNDLQRILAKVTRFQDWPAAWRRLGDERMELGEQARAQGRSVSAGAAFQQASLCYHFGQFVLFDDPQEKLRLQHLQRDAFARAAPHLRPPAQLIEIPFEGAHLGGTLRLPARVGALPPCVMLNPGADSMREEFHTLENELLARGLATFSYEGPGQGLVWRDLKLRPDYEVPIAALIDGLLALGVVDPGRIGIWGRSFGAYCALRGATDPRIRACVSIGGFYDMGDVWSRMPKGTTDSLGFAMGVGSRAEGAEAARAYTLKGVLGRVGCPVLIVHSGQDNVCPVAESRRMIDELGPEAELRVFAEGNHVCDNIPYRVRPLMADWLAEKLRVRDD